MNMHTKTNLHHFLWIPVLLIALLFSACASGGTPNTASKIPSATHRATAQPTLKVDPFSGPVTYVALGASDAVGVGSREPGSQGYVPLVATHLPKGSHLVNLGISGIHLHEALSEELPLALSTSPDLVTIWLVTNDFIGGVTYNGYIQDLNILLRELHTKTQARLVMANLPDLTRLPAFAHETSTRKAQMLTAIQQWNAGIAAAAAHYGVTLVDLFSQRSQLTSHPEYISADGFHPSAQGYVQLANAFWKAIKG